MGTNFFGFFFLTAILEFGGFSHSVSKEICVYFLRNFLKKILFILRERERESTSNGEGQRGREKQTPPLRREPDLGLDSMTPGSTPEPKADA